jgi:ketosteroid isomerase-like protein
MALTEKQMIEGLRRQTEALNRGDFDAAMELADADIVLVRAGGLPELRGTEAVRAWLEPDAFESQVYELLGFEFHENRVLTRSLTKARGAGSGIEMEIEALSVWTFSDAGKVTRMETFLTSEVDEARRALRAS